MNPFEHLAVLISIILGLGISHLLSNVHELVQARARVRFHWLPIIWSTLVFIGLVQWWWASFGMHGQREWNFFYFLFVLLKPVSAYLSAAAVLPKIEPGQPCDLRAYYFGARRWLFLLLAFGNVLDGLRRMLSGEEIQDVAVWSNFVSCALLGSLAFSANERLHTVVTLLTAGLFASFILTAALQLA